MDGRDFFGESKPQSVVKAKIVSKYFGVWANIIGNVLRSQASLDKRLVYLDLFAGQGVYDDGTKSTPLIIMEQAIANQFLANNLVAVFNDANSDFIAKLQREAEALQGYAQLRHVPQFSSVVVDANIAEYLKAREHLPTLLFIDPCGYKGLSLELINSVVKHWACDCIFFFNYVRINAAITNQFMDEHVTALFGAEHLATIRRAVDGKSVEEREEVVMNALQDALRGTYTRHVHAFKFIKEDERRTSHFLLLASKSEKAYFEFKEVAAKESSIFHQGVPSFTFDPHPPVQGGLFVPKPMDQLLTELPQRYEGKRLSRDQIFKEHSIGTPYIKANYGEALATLEERGLIQADPPISEKRKRPKRNGKQSFGEDVIAIFPRS